VLASNLEVSDVPLEALWQICPSHRDAVTNLVNKQHVTF
jgi:hypothetical protein